MTDDRGIDRRRVIQAAGVLAAGALVQRGGPALAAGPPPSPVSAGAAPADAAHAWMSAIYDAIWAEGHTPPNAARVYAYCTIAMYEAVVPGAPNHRSLGGQLHGLGSLPGPAPRDRVDWPVVLSSSVAIVTAELFAAASETSRALLQATHDRIVATARSSGLADPIVRRSLDQGRRVGEALLAWMRQDGYAATVGRPYVPPTGPSMWMSTPPNFGRAIEPHWAEVRPMVLRDAAEIEPEPHVPFSEDAGSAFHEQAMVTYRTGLTLTDEQRAIARFWTDNPLLSGLPSGHWLLIAQQASRQVGARLDLAVEAYARTGIALHDAFLNCWTWKYRYNLIRPITYVRRLVDPAWNTFVNTPQFPEYTSGHSVSSVAAAGALTGLFGDLAFTDDSHADRNLPARRFTSFRHAAEEAAQSRIYGGIHFPMGIEAGKAQGEAVAARIAERLRTRR